MIKSFLIALKFLTILPVGKNLEFQDKPPTTFRKNSSNKQNPQKVVGGKELAKSASYFPLVGALIGLLLVAVDFILRPLFPNSIVNLFILITLIVITGALHLDGFMDSIDGLFSGKDKNRILEIMRDSKIGAFAAVAVIFLLLLKLSFLNEISSGIRYQVLIAMPVISRWSAVYAIWKYPYARSAPGKGEPFARLVEKKQLIVATVFTSILAFSLLQFRGIAIWLAAFLILLLLTRLINKKIGGMTGDAYGAIIETLEVVTLVSVYFIYS